MPAQRTSAELTFREFTRSDLPSLIELWEGAGWGSLDESMWEQWYEKTPHGPSIVMVVEDDLGAIAGQFAMVPSEVSVAGRRVHALRSSAILLRDDVIRHRPAGGTGLRHPLLGLAVSGFELARSRGYALAYALPHRKALAIFRALNRYGVASVRLAKYGCVEIDADRMPADVLEHLTVRPVGSLTEEHEAIAARTPGALATGCHVVRSLDWLRWRLGAHRLTEVRRATGELVAVTAVDPRHDLLADLLVADELSVAVALAAAAVTSPSKRVNVMVLPQFSAAVERLDATPVDYEFAFACWSLDETTLAPETIDPAAWLPMHAD